MNNTVTLQTMKCPTCGGKLKVANIEVPIECIYCGNNIVPVNNNVPVANTNNSNAITNAQIRIDGLNNAKSALAYIEIFFETYSWDAFKYSDNISIPELDDVKNELLKISADDKNTWIFCFEITLVPYIKKTEYTKAWLNEIIAEYKKGNLDAYGKML